MEKTPNSWGSNGTIFKTAEKALDSIKNKPWFKLIAKFEIIVYEPKLTTLVDHNGSVRGSVYLYDFEITGYEIREGNEGAVVLTELEFD